MRMTVTMYMCILAIVFLITSGATSPCLIKDTLELNKPGQASPGAICQDASINAVLLNGSMHLSSNYPSCPASRNAIDNKSTSSSQQATKCKPQCNLVLHKTVCPDGRLCPIPDVSPSACSKIRFACSLYSIADLKRVSDVCEKKADAVWKCSGGCGRLRTTYSLETGSCSRIASTLEADLNLGKQLHLPLRNIEFGKEEDNDEWQFEGDIYVRTYASSQEVFEALESSLFDPFVILFREFNPCLNELLHSNGHTVFLYLPSQGTLFEFGIARSRNNLTGTSAVSVCTVAGDDSRFVIGQILMVTGFGLSLAGLVTTIISVFLTGENRSIPGMNLLCLSFSLLVAYVTVIVVKTIRGINEPCLPEGILHVVGILASLAWMNVMAFDIWNTLSKMYVDDVVSGRKLFCYCVYGWGLPVVILMVGVLVDHLPSVPPTLKPRFSLGQCWFYMGFNTWGTVIFYYGPIGVIISVNMILFLLTVRIILQSQLMQARLDDGARMHKKIKYQFKLYLKLFLVMGLTWSLEVTNLLLPIPEVFIVSDFVNTLQGFSIFVIFTCKPHVLKVFAYYCCPKQLAIVSKEELCKSARRFATKQYCRKLSVETISFQNIKRGACTKI